jgi:hypothetical protein
MLPQVNICSSSTHIKILININRRFQKVPTFVGGNLQIQSRKSMEASRYKNILSRAGLFFAILLLSGCQSALLDPKGMVHGKIIIN